MTASQPLAITRATTRPTEVSLLEEEEEEEASHIFSSMLEYVEAAHATGIHELEQSDDNPSVSCG